MASLGVVASTALVGALLLVALPLILYWSSAPAVVLHPAINSWYYRSLNLRATKVVIDEVVVVSNDTITLDVSNRGSTSFKASNIDLFDLIVRYVDVNGVVRIVRLVYDPDLSSPCTWCVTEVQTDGVAGEAINPMNPPYLSKGMWDPCEDLAITLYLDPPMNSSQPFTLVFSTPNGFVASYGGGS